jgi:hypothetical protein
MGVWRLPKMAATNCQNCQQERLRKSSRTAVKCHCGKRRTEVPLINLSG